MKRSAYFISILALVAAILNIYGCYDTDGGGSGGDSIINDGDSGSTDDGSGSGDGGDVGDVVSSFECPSISDNVTWESYGRFKLHDSGPDSAALEIIKECNWHIFGNNSGGVGNTLQIGSPNDEVILVWAYNNFSRFHLSGGWIGTMPGGIRLGDHITSLYAQNPAFKTRDGITHTLSSNSNQYVDVVEILSENDIIVRASVWYFP